MPAGFLPSAVRTGTTAGAFPAVWDSRSCIPLARTLGRLSSVNLKLRRGLMEMNIFARLSREAAQRAMQPEKDWPQKTMRNVRMKVRASE